MRTMRRERRSQNSTRSRSKNSFFPRPSTRRVTSVAATSAVAQPLSQIDTHRQELCWQRDSDENPQRSCRHGADQNPAAPFCLQHRAELLRLGRPLLRLLPPASPPRSLRKRKRRRSSVTWRCATACQHGHRTKRFPRSCFSTTRFSNDHWGTSMHCEPSNEFMSELHRAANKSALCAAR